MDTEACTLLGAVVVDTHLGAVEVDTLLGVVVVDARLMVVMYIQVAAVVQSALVFLHRLYRTYDCTSCSSWCACVVGRNKGNLWGKVLKYVCMYKGC